MHLRKDVNVFIHLPSVKFFQVVVELKNIPGALGSVLQVLQDTGVNVLGSFTSVEPFAKTGVWSAFVEGSRHTASELKKTISSSQHVLDSMVVEGNDGFLVDGVHFPLSLNNGDRALLMRTKHLATMFERVCREFGTGGRAIVFEEGVIYGKESWSDFKTRIGEEFVRTNLLDVLKIYQSMGWFRLEGLEQNKLDRSVKIRTTRNFECEGNRSRSPRSDFVRGHLSGALTALLGEEMACEETRCVAAGDPYCEFVLRPGTKLAKPVPLARPTRGPSELLASKALASVS